MAASTNPDELIRIVTFTRPIERVWDAITAPEKLVQWMCESVQPYRLIPGEMLEMRWGEERFRAEIVTVNPPHEFAWRWYPGSGEDLDRPLDEQGPLTLVRFTLESVPEGTRLTLRETGFGALSAERLRLAFAENTNGWADCLGSLAAVVESADVHE